MWIFRVYLILILNLSAVAAAMGESLPPPPPEAQRELKEIRVAVPIIGPKKTEMEGWEAFLKATEAASKKSFRFQRCPSSLEASKLLAAGKVDFAVLEPEDYVRISEETENGATLAVLDTQGRYGFQASLLVRPGSVHENQSDVLSSSATIGLLRVDGFVGRFYRGPFTDETWRVRAEFQKRIVYGRTGNELIKRLRDATGGRKLDAVLLPVSELEEVDSQGIRNGLRELWLSPFCPGRVVAARAGLGKRQRFQLGEVMVSGAQNRVLEKAGIGGFRLIEDSAFDALREFLPVKQP